MTAGTSDRGPTTRVRLTQYAHGGGCACKIPPGELEAVLAGLRLDAPLPDPYGPLLVGLDTGDDAAVVAAPDGGPAYVLTTDFFTPVVDDAYDWGRIAAANALSDIYAMGGRPVVAVNILGWPRDGSAHGTRGRGAARRPRHRDLGRAAIWSAGTASTTRSRSTAWPCPASSTRTGCCATTPAGPGNRLSLTKPLGIGVLNTRHKATGETFDHAVAAMTTLNREAANAAVERGCRCATDVTGFGLLGHLLKLARASGVTAVIDSAAVPYLDGARESAGAGYISGGTRRNLDWVRSGTDLGDLDETEALLLADAQTSGGLIVAGEVPGAPIIGELVARGEHLVVVR